MSSNDEEIVNPRGLGQAMRVYAEHAARLASLSSPVAAPLRRLAWKPGEIDLVIAVSCTGYLVPSLDVQLAAEIGLRPDVIRLPLTELGCSGGAAALAAAYRHLSARPRDRVLVVAVEAGDGLAIALGPGVTIELAHLRVVQHTGGMTRTLPRNAAS